MKNNRTRIFLTCLLILNLFTAVNAQPFNRAEPDQIYVDKAGVIRWRKSNKEAAFFGVNYTVPFAYGYRSHKALGLNLEQAIEQDVYHLSRLGLDAFRVHIWDAEISDKEGNLLKNEHLRLFDYLVGQLEKRNIKILITPIAFWGNGYPEKDEATGSFSNVYGKDSSVVTEKAFLAQERYIGQLLTHKNPYTQKSYQEDQGIIALEINNEPHHSGPKQRTTEYINRMARAVRNTGWTKPIFYNISESPAYSDAVVKGNVDGHSFQWYPTGLVANQTLKGNYLPHVDKYHIPFDSIPGFKNRAKMVYEFDAGDILQSNMYPAMARSFRTAGFQWATQFAYDPMGTAFANTEYQTHYLNLAYTPSKAISLLIASKAFHLLPRLKSYGSYPADTLFNGFRVSYRQSLSEMNTASEFYYSNSTNTIPADRSALKNIAGVGNSEVVKYEGYGAYFLDKLENGIWRLELMPDAIHIRDPFEKASLQKAVTRIQWESQSMKILLPDLGRGFAIRGLNDGNSFSSTSGVDGFRITPGTYLIVRKGKNSQKWKPESRFGTMALSEFVAPKNIIAEPLIIHSPLPEVTAKKSFLIKVKGTGVNEKDRLYIDIHNSANQWRTLPLERRSSYDYEAEVPADLISPGLLKYRIHIERSERRFIAFPGEIRGNPQDWDYINNDYYQTYVAAPNSPIEIFNANSNSHEVNAYIPDWKIYSMRQVASGKPHQLLLAASINNSQAGQEMSWQFYFFDKVAGRQTELPEMDKLVLKARSANGPLNGKISLIGKDGLSYAAPVTVSNQLAEIVIPLASFVRESSMLLPRPYPAFMPLHFMSIPAIKMNVKELEKIQISFKADQSPFTTLEIEDIAFESKSNLIYLR